MAETSYDVNARAVVLPLTGAAGCWVISVTQMRGMDMGVGTGLGSFGFFVGVWTAMMAAMMLPAAAPAVASYARSHRRFGAAAMFVVTYVAVWTLFGVASYAVYRPHSSTVAIVITVAACLYELTPIKRRARRRCQQRANSGFNYGIDCLMSSVGLMLLLFAWGAMSITWMSIVAVLVLIQKLVPVKGDLT